MNKLKKTLTCLIKSVFFISICLFLFTFLFNYSISNKKIVNEYDTISSQKIENIEIGHPSIKGISTGYEIIEKKKVQQIYIEYDGIITSDYKWSVYESSSESSNYQKSSPIDDPDATEIIPSTDFPDEFINSPSDLKGTIKIEDKYSLVTDTCYIFVMEYGEEYQDEKYQETYSFDYKDDLNKFISNVENIQTTVDRISFDFVYSQPTTTDSLEGKKVIFTLKNNNNNIEDIDKDLNNGSENQFTIKITFENLSSNTEYELSWKVYSTTDNIPIHTGYVRSIFTNVITTKISIEVTEINGSFFTLSIDLEDIKQFRPEDLNLSIDFKNDKFFNDEYPMNKIIYHKKNSDKIIKTGEEIKITKSSFDNIENDYQPGDNDFSFKLNFSIMNPLEDEKIIITAGYTDKNVDYINAETSVEFNYQNGYILDSNSLTVENFLIENNEYIYELSLNTYNPKNSIINIENDIFFYNYNKENKIFEEQKGIKVLNYNDDSIKIDKFKKYNPNNLYVQFSQISFPNVDFTKGDISFLISNDIYIANKNHENNTKQNNSQFTFYEISNVKNFYFFPWEAIYIPSIILFILFIFYLVWLFWYINKKRRSLIIRKKLIQAEEILIEQFIIYGWSPKIDDYLRIKNMSSPQLKKYSKKIGIFLKPRMKRQEKIDLLCLLSEIELTRVKEYINIDINMSLNSINLSKENILNSKIENKWIKRIIWNNELNNKMNTDKTFVLPKPDLIFRMNNLFRKKITLKLKKIFKKKGDLNE